MRVLVCIPFYNEAPVAKLVATEIRDLLLGNGAISVLVIDDGSTDAGLSEIQKIIHPSLFIVKNQSNEGIGACIEKSRDFAKSAGFTHLCLWPGNSRVAATSILKLLAAQAEDNCYVHGSRFQEARVLGNTPHWKLLLIRVGSLIASRAAGVKLQDITCGVRFFPVGLLDSSVHLQGTEYRAEQIITIAALSQGLQLNHFPIPIAYLDHRPYSHLSAAKYYQVILPWISYFLDGER